MFRWELSKEDHQPGSIKSGRSSTLDDAWASLEEEAARWVTQQLTEGDNRYGKTGQEPTEEDDSLWAEWWAEQGGNRPPREVDAEWISNRRWEHAWARPDGTPYEEDIYDRERKYRLTNTRVIRGDVIPDW